MTIKLHAKDKTIVVDWPTVPENGDMVEIEGKTYWTTYDMSAGKPTILIVG